MNSISIDTIHLMNLIFRNFQVKYLTIICQLYDTFQLHKLMHLVTPIDYYIQCYPISSYRNERRCCAITNRQRCINERDINSNLCKKHYKIILATSPFAIIDSK